MVSSNSKALPTELLFNICEQLYHIHPVSLLSFAKSSKACYKIAATFLFRTIWVFVSDPRYLTINVQQHSKRLRRLKAFGNVRRLVIYGPGVDFPFDYTKDDLKKSQSILTPGLEVDLDNRFSRTRSYDIVPSRSPVHNAYENDDSWLPLVELIQRLPTLSDLVYQCSAQFPPCLLQALHRYRPRCRLHIDNFSLHSLVGKPPVPDSHELLVATSPCLYSINMRVSGASDGLPIHHIGAVLRLVAGLAPNLKEVHLFRGHKSSWNEDEEHSSFDPPWGNLPIARACPWEQGSLSCLQLWGRAVTGQVLADWSTHTNFAVLRTLKITGQLTEDALNNLASSHHKFPSLKALALTLKVPTNYERTRYYKLARRFVCRLKRLRSLEIRRWSHHIDLDTILSSRLRTLRLVSCQGKHLTLQDITQIRERCPLLQDLTLTVRRSKGDANETAVYRELGKFPKLEHLCLEMDALLPPRVRGKDVPPDPSFNNYDREPSTLRHYKKGHIRDFFINNAMDDDLALAIFKMISKIKQRNYLAPLEKLEISFVRDEDSHEAHKVSSYLGKYATALSRPWQVKRRPRGNSSRSPIAWEVDKGTRKLQEKNHDKARNMLGNEPDLAEQESIFRRIWPEQWEGSNWREDWESWPLSSSTS
ncbi:hypothetical protein F4804DRAFT_296215 [Jackrogersella minutella]|nr:hypothetical protein F4804DRAFT_296215 [Jackrogersella minutella]